MHEDVIVNCSSPRSLPPATLTFYVNDEQVRQIVALCIGLVFECFVSVYNR